MVDHDAEAFAAEERAQWDSVAAGWRKWWHTFEGGAQGLNERLVELAGVAPGHRVLDVATGLGEPALTAARAAGPTGSVVGCDLSPGMLAFAAERAAEHGLTGVAFVEQNAEQLDLGDARFDAAVCRWGLMLMRDPLAAAGRVREVLLEGATFAAAVWCGPEDVPFLALPMQVFRRELDLPAPDPSEPGPFRLKDPDALPRLLRDAGFRDVASERVTVPLRFDSAASFATFVRDMSSRVGRVLREVDERTRERLLAALTAAAQELVDADGRIHFANAVHVASGRR